jgi:hypothetical protein
MENEFLVFIRGNVVDSKRKCHDGFELKPHSSGFDGEYYSEKNAREDAELFEKDVVKERNKRIGKLSGLVKRIENREIHISPFAC